MWKPIYNPGPWSQFLKRKDNKGLPIMEVRKKYLQEQLLFENYNSYLLTLNTVSPSAASAGGGGGPLPALSSPSGQRVIPDFRNTEVVLTYELDMSSWRAVSNEDYVEDVNTWYLQYDAASSNGLTSKSTQLFDFANDYPDAYMTVDWGDGSTSIIDYNTSLNATHRVDTLGKFHAGGGDIASIYIPSQNRWSYYTGSIDGVGQQNTFWGYGLLIGHVYSTSSANYPNFTVTVTGPAGLIQNIETEASPYWWTGNTPQWDPSGSIDFRPRYLPYHYSYPFGPIKNVTYSTHTGMDNKTWRGANLLNLEAFSAQGSRLLVDLTDPNNTLPNEIINIFNAGPEPSDRTLTADGTYDQVFQGIISASEAGIDITNWDVSNMEDLSYAFKAAPSIPGNISGWDISNVKDLQYFFAVDSYPVKSGSVTDPAYQLINVNDQDIRQWTGKTNNIEILTGFAYGSPNYNNNLISGWSLPSLTNASSMFRDRTTGTPSQCGISDTNLEYILKAWADNPNTANNVNASNFATNRTYSPGSDMDLAIQALTAKGWTISGITIA